MDRKHLERYIRKEMRRKITQYPIFGEVIYESLAGIHELLERTKKNYTLFAYVRRGKDRWHENILHIQMHFKNAQERDALWNRASEKLEKNIQSGMRKATDPKEKLEIENILCAVRSEKQPSRLLTRKKNTRGEMGMRLTVLGSGVFKPRTARYPAGLALTLGNKTIVFDAGSGTFMRLMEAGIDYGQIDYIFVTHLHIDHVSDLLQYLWAYHLDRRKDLCLFGPPGLGRFYEHLTELASQFSHLPFELRLKEVDEGGSIPLPFCRIEVGRTHHVDELVSICYKVEANKKIFGYSGDTGYSEKLTQFFKGADVLVLECTTLNEQKVKGHLVPKECAEIAKRAHVKKLVLTHLDLDLGKVKDQCSQDFCGEIIVAEDLMQVVI